MGTCSSRRARARSRVLRCGLITGAVLLVGAPAAFAAPTATFTGGTLTVTGDATDESFTVSTVGLNVQVAGSTSIPDPDGAGTDCVASGTTVTCTDAATNTVVINGGAGNDGLTSTTTGFATGISRLNGDAGNDVLTRNSFSFSGVQLNGGAGDDVLNAGTGALRGGDTGGDGNDTFNGSAQNEDFFTAENGSDTYNGGTRVATPSELVDRPETYQRFAAEDVVSYSARTSPVAVSLDAVANDGLSGEADNIGADIESVSGGTANDTLSAGAASIGLFGGDGDDGLLGGPSDDDLNGGEGTDVIAGGAGDDALRDGDQFFLDPIISPGDPAAPVPGNDRLDGGAGNDSLSSDRGADDLAGGAGTDSARFFRSIPQASTVTTPIQPAAFTITVDNVANDGVTGAAEGDNVHTDIEEIFTGDGADTVTGSPGPEEIFTGDGNDTITPGAGSDLVRAGFGNDAINALDSTTDRIDCGRDSDTATVDLPGGQPVRSDVVIDCEAIGGQGFAPLVDTSKPVLKVTARSVKSRTFLRNGVLTLKVTCSKACAVTGQAFSGRLVGGVTLGRRQIGSGKLSLGPALATRTMKVKVAKRYLKGFKKRLRTKKQRRKGITFSVNVAATDAIGIQARLTKTVKVRG